VSVAARAASPGPAFFAGRPVFFAQEW
jgi:hypothetical protein